MQIDRNQKKMSLFASLPLYEKRYARELDIARIIHIQYGKDELNFYIICIHYLYLGTWYNIQEARPGKCLIFNLQELMMTNPSFQMNE